MNVDVDATRTFRVRPGSCSDLLLRLAACPRLTPFVGKSLSTAPATVVSSATAIASLINYPSHTSTVHQSNVLLLDRSLFPFPSNLTALDKTTRFDPVQHNSLLVSINSRHVQPPVDKKRSTHGCSSVSVHLHLMSVGGNRNETKTTSSVPLRVCCYPYCRMEPQLDDRFIRLQGNQRYLLPTAVGTLTPALAQ